MYQNITDDKGCIDAIERTFGTGHAEQAAHLYEDQLEDPDNFSIEALREIEEYLSDRFEEDTDAEYIIKQARTLIERDAEEVRVALVEKIEAEDEYLTEATKTIKLEMKLDAMIALAIGSGRTELLPSEERIRQNLTPDENTTPNEAALMKNLEGWIGMAVEASRYLIEAKERAAKFELRAEEAEQRLMLIDCYTKKLGRVNVDIQRVANGHTEQDDVYDEGQEACLW